MHFKNPKRNVEVVEVAWIFFKAHLPIDSNFNRILNSIHFCDYYHYLNAILMCYFFFYKRLAIVCFNRFLSITAMCYVCLLFYLYIRTWFFVFILFRFIFRFSASFCAISSFCCSVHAIKMNLTLGQVCLL